MRVMPFLLYSLQAPKQPLRSALQSNLYDLQALKQRGWGGVLQRFVDQFWPQTRNGLTLGSIYAMIALGYTMVYGVLQLINFAHSEVFMVSTFTTLFVYRHWFNVAAPRRAVDCWCFWWVASSLR